MKRLYLGLLILLCHAVPALADVPAVHGMLLFGNKVTYASHLPMFHHPHDYQAILRLTLADMPNQHAVKAYEAAKATSPELFTLVPEAMDLTQVLSGSKTSFRAEVFKGHFERGGESLGPVVVSVTRVVHGRKLEAHAGPSATFLAFGEGGEYYAAHLIKGQPTYDAIMAIEAPYRMKRICGRVGCSEPQKWRLLDYELPILVGGRHEQAQTPPAEGLLLGEGGGKVFAQIARMIYVEVDELNP